MGRRVRRRNKATQQLQHSVLPRKAEGKKEGEKNCGREEEKRLSEEPRL